MSFVTTLLLLIYLYIPIPQPTIDQQIWFYASLNNVDPKLSLAITRAETGNVPEHLRDTIISRGNYGRYQILASTWKKHLGLKNSRELLNSTTNIRWGNYILGKFQRRFAGKNGCRCGKKHHWTCHWNSGIVCNKHSEKFSRRVLYHLESIKRKR